jgi:hypothetical protein
LKLLLKCDRSNTFAFNLEFLYKTTMGKMLVEDCCKVAIAPRVDASQRINSSNGKCVGAIAFCKGVVGI